MSYTGDSFKDNEAKLKSHRLICRNAACGFYIDTSRNYGIVAIDYLRVSITIVSTSGVLGKRSNGTIR